MWRVRDISVLLAVLTVSGQARQPSAPEAYAAPLRDLHFGQVNFLHTTDTHGWHAGHLLEPSYSADWGDYIDFAARLREKLEAEGKDLLLVDTGDRIEGNGLYDGSRPRGKYTFGIVEAQPIDLICSGNHELYKISSSENEYLETVPHYKHNYLASNIDIQDPETGDIVPLAPRFKKFTTPKQGIRIMSFAFLYNFQRNSDNTIIHTVEEAIKEKWFQVAIRDREVDLIVIIGHAAVRSDEFKAIYEAIRQVQWDTPIQFFGGHYHIRDYKKFDSKSYALASGRFMETIGFQSIDGLTSHDTEPHAEKAVTFFRRYIDNNLYSFYHHSGHNESTFHSQRGQNVSKMIADDRHKLNLDTTFGCAPRNLWMSRARYPSNDSIFTWLEERMLPEAINDTTRDNKARLILLNTGAIRFDIFKGQFTKDSTYIVSPFTSAFHYIPDVPYKKAKNLLRLLNSGGEILEQVDPTLQLFALAPPEQFGASDVGVDHVTDLRGSRQAQLRGSATLMPGYTTHDDAGKDGDDTMHSPISFYRVPNCVQATVNPKGSDLEEATVDLVFNEFIQPYALLGLRFLGLDYSDHDVLDYMNNESFTDLLSNWIASNWADNC